MLTNIVRMGDLLGFQGFLNVTTPFNWNEYDYVWKDPGRRYHDFQPGNAVNKSCQYPRIWAQDGYISDSSVTNMMQGGCRASEIDMVWEPLCRILFLGANSGFTISTEISRELAPTLATRTSFQNLLPFRIDYANGCQMCLRRSISCPA